MDDRELLEGVLDEIGVTRPELEHVLGCDEGCSVTGAYDEPGPVFCLAFRTGFRGYVPQPCPRAPGLVPALWAQEVAACLQRHLIYGSRSGGLLRSPEDSRLGER